MRPLSCDGSISKHQLFYTVTDQRLSICFDNSSPMHSVEFGQALRCSVASLLIQQALSQTALINRFIYAEIDEIRLLMPESTRMYRSVSDVNASRLAILYNDTLPARQQPAYGCNASGAMTS